MRCLGANESWFTLLRQDAERRPKDAFGDDADAPLAAVGSFRGVVGVPRGASQASPFGTRCDYDRTIVIERGTCGVREGDVIVPLRLVPSGASAMAGGSGGDAVTAYRVVRVAQTPNFDILALVASAAAERAVIREFS